MTETALTPRWQPLRFHPEQHRLRTLPHRFKVVPAGRRSGKTELAKRFIVQRALMPTAFPDPHFFAAAPTWMQAKRIFWPDIKKLIPRKFMIGRPSESELMIRLVTGAEIYVVGLDKPERIEGQPWDGGILDEYGNMKQSAWEEHVRPALSDRQGWCWFIGVPEGRNHYYDLYRKARSDESGQWAAFHWISADILPPEEIEAARRDLDELTFRQEYEADFVNFQGRAYYPFMEHIHCDRLEYDPKQPLIFCFDFNVSPGVAAVIQEQKLPNGQDGSGVIGEVYIPRNSNTPAVCRKLIADWCNHLGTVFCYGDATGGARGSAKVAGSDWDLVREGIKHHFGERCHFRVPKENPRERPRINAVNSRLMNHAGEVRLMVDPVKAPHVVRDFEGVQLLEGGGGEIDKNADPNLTHLCFAEDTLVEIETGIMPISKIPTEGKVRAWNGKFTNYINASKTGNSVSVVKIFFENGEEIRCTPQHQWLTTEGWTNALMLKNKIALSWKSKLSEIPDRTLTGKNFIGSMGQNDILEGQAERANNTCIGLYGFIIMVKYLKGFTSTIRTGIELIIRFKTLNWLPLKNIGQNTTKQMEIKEKKQNLKDCQRQERQQRSGIKVKKEFNGTISTIKICVKNYMLKISNVFVYIVARSLCLSGMQNIVAKTANRDIDTTKRSTMRKEFVSGAVLFSRPTDIQNSNIVQENALKIIDVVPFGTTDVYCLNVPVEKCFCLANGAIVSNSDAIGYYINYVFPIADRVREAKEFRI